MAYGSRRNKGKGLSDFNKPGGEEERRKKRRREKDVEKAVATAEHVPEAKPKKAAKPKSGIVGNVREVDIATVKPNDYNYNQMSAYMTEKLKANIKEFGFLEPIIVRSGNDKGPFEDGRLEIINGYHRWLACTENKMPSIRVLDIGNVPDIRAKTLTINLNEIGGRPDQSQLDILVAEISKMGGTELVDLLPWDAAQIEAMVAVGDKDWDALADISDEETESTGGSGEDEAEEDEENPVTFLGLADTTAKQDVKFVMRLEEIAKKVQFDAAKPGDLFGKLLAMVETHLGITVDPKIAIAVDEADDDSEEVEDADEDTEDEDEE